MFQALRLIPERSEASRRTLREVAEHRAGGEGPLPAFQNVSQPQGCTFQAGFTCSLPLFLWTEPPCRFTYPGFKVQGKGTETFPKPWENVLAFEKLFFIVLMKIHRGSDGKKMP